MRKLIVGLVLLVASLLVAPPSAAGSLPTETFGCGDDVDHSVRLGADVGSLAAGCNETGLRITKSGITLDLNGHTIYGDREDGPASVEAGVLVQLVKNVTVRNGAVRGFVDGVRATTSNDGSTFKRLVSADNLDRGFNVSGGGLTLTDNVSVNNSGRGMHIGSSGARVHRNLVVSNSAEGIWFNFGKKSSIKKNVVSGSGSAAIRLQSGDGSIVVGNMVSSNAQGMFLTGPRLEVRKNTAASNGGSGILVIGDRSKLVANRVSNSFLHGIQLLGDDGVASRNVSSANRRDGIDVTGDRDVVSRNRTDGNADHGISSDGAAAVIVANKVRGNGETGILALGSARIEKNLAVGNGFSLFGGNLGIDASGATVKGGGNVSRVNDDPDQCEPTTLCKQITTDLPPANLLCGAEVNGSVRLTSDVGSSGNPCLFGGLTVTKDGIEIDLDGHTIWGDTANDDAMNGSERGIDLEGRSDVHVYDGAVDGFERGISAGGSKRVRVSDVEIRGSAGSGFSDFPGGHRPKVKRVVAMNNDVTGVQIFSTSSRIRDVVAIGNTRNGISGLRDMRISGSVAAGNEGSGIGVACCTPLGGAKISKSTVFNNEANGIIVRNGDATITNSIVTRNGLQLGDFQSGIKLTTDAPDALLVNNIVSFHGTAGYESAAERTTFKNNFSAGNIGVSFLVSGADAVLKKNQSISGVADGLRLSGDNSVVHRNLFVGHTGEGIDATGSDLEITKNLIAANKPDGILIGAASNVLVHRNRALGNGYGLTDAQVDGVGRGINAAGGVTGSNVAYGNDDDDDCDPPTLC